MISRNNGYNISGHRKWTGRNGFLLGWLAFLIITAVSCKIYSFNDVSVPADIKTIRVNYIENHARYINPQLSPQLTDKLRQKINNQTKLTLVQGDNADYDVHAEIRDYAVTTSGISSNPNGTNRQAATNRLTVSVHVTVINNKDQSKNIEGDVSRNFDFSATLSLQQAEAQLGDNIIQNLSDEIFNKIFSSW